MFNNKIAIYASHETSISVKIGDVYRIYELERVTRNRYEYLALGSRLNPQYKNILSKAHELIKDEFGINKFNECFVNVLHPQVGAEIQRLWSIKKFNFVSHHLSHAASAFYTSGYKKAIVISYDGGGMDEDGVSFFNIYIGENGKLTKIHKINSDLGTAYQLMGMPIKELRKGGTNLSLPGKLMGMCAYGKIEDKYHSEFIKFFKSSGQTLDKLELIGKRIGLNLSLDSCEGEESYRLAAHAQKAFEEVSFDIISPVLKRHKGLPICLTGGCALNVLMNEKIRKRFSVPVFVPPNPSDCGLSFGMLMAKDPPKDPPKIVYAGPKLFDYHRLDAYVNKYKAEKISVDSLADLLSQGSIIGIATGRAECGPRALGNRSIVCDPGIASMKDILNKKIKHREWFRPFAPFVRYEERNKYFEFDGESPFMSFASSVRQEWADKLHAITHVDGTARIQTVKEDEHKFFYDLLGSFENKKGYGVLLNTSFNIKGKPILNSIKDAISVLEETEMDYLYIEGYLFERKKYELRRING